MPALLGPALLRVWEAGQGRHPVDQALLVLSTACPEISPDELAVLSIGQRDACLLAVYEETFGPNLAGLADCPECGETLEFELHTPEIQVAPEIESVDAVHQLTTNGYRVRFRLPNSLDLAAIARQETSAASLTSARRVLAQRCVLEVTHAEQAVSTEDLPAPVISALAAEMAEADPQAEMTLNFVCPECGHGWQAVLDIVTFLWARIGDRAQRLLRDVHRLARAYGWREADILSMSDARREFYLDLVT
jgi:hypothetical protein